MQSPATMSFCRRTRSNCPARGFSTIASSSKSWCCSYLQGRPAALAYVQDFVKQSIASGLLQKNIDRSGRPGLNVAV
jgi:hypothetical protein